MEKTLVHAGQCTKVNPLAAPAVAGLLVGMVYSITSLYFPDLAELSIFVLMALVLMFRPQGFFGRTGLMS